MRRCVSLVSTHFLLLWDFFSTSFSFALYLLYCLPFYSSFFLLKLFPSKKEKENRSAENYFLTLFLFFCDWGCCLCGVRELRCHLPFPPSSSFSSGAVRPADIELHICFWVDLQQTPTYHVSLSLQSIGLHANLDFLRISVLIVKARRRWWTWTLIHKWGRRAK